MGLNAIGAGKNAPETVNVIVEIPKDAEPVKYEVDKETGEVFVDRVLTTPMRYPANYGYVPQTLGGDGDPLDVLIIVPQPFITRSVARCRPVGMLNMTDEKGADEKLVVVPDEKIFPGFDFIKNIDQVPKDWLDRIGHFFKHYKDLEKGKWVEIDGWEGIDAAKQVIIDGLKRYQQS